MLRNARQAGRCGCFYREAHSCILRRMTMQNIPEIRFEEISGRQGNLGVITLNRPQVLNALNHAMFTAINSQLTEWESGTQIKAVVIRAAEGRAFCAGGDIRYA